MKLQIITLSVSDFSITSNVELKPNLRLKTFIKYKGIQYIKKHISKRVSVNFYSLQLFSNEIASLSLETNKYILLVYTVNHIPKDLITIIITFSMTLTKPIIYQNY